MGLPSVRKQLGAVSPPSTDFVSSPKQDRDKDNLGRTLEGVGWLILLLFQPYHQCLCHFVFS